VGLAIMLRSYFVATAVWPTDSRMEEASHDSDALRRFAEVGLGVAPR
jgi:hypothetical protein